MKPATYIVNAFTASGKNGNPAGVVLNADGLSDKQMLEIARELDVSDTAFVSASSNATRKVRFFTRAREIDLCGHATIATWSLLHKLGEVSTGMHTQETQAGLLQISIKDGGLVFMEQARARFFDKIDPREIAAMLGLEERDLHASLRPQIVSTGVRDLFVPVIDKSVLPRLKPNLQAIATFSEQHDISGFHVFALLEDEASLAAARNFAPADGIPEECATGTSNGALLCYLRDNGALPDREVYRVEQGEGMGRLSYVYGTFKGDIVWIGGSADVVEQRVTSA